MFHRKDLLFEIQVQGNGGEGKTQNQEANVYEEDYSDRTVLKRDDNQNIKRDVRVDNGVEPYQSGVEVRTFKVKRQDPTLLLNIVVRIQAIYFLVQAAISTGNLLVSIEKVKNVEKDKGPEGLSVQVHEMNRIAYEEGDVVGYKTDN